MKLQEKLQRSEKRSKTVKLEILLEWVGSAHHAKIVSGVAKGKKICVSKTLERFALVTKVDFPTSGEEIVDSASRSQKNFHLNLLGL